VAYANARNVIAKEVSMVIKSAPTRLLLLDSSKIGVGALYHLGEIGDFTHLITDDGTPKTLLDQARESGLEVVVAPIVESSAQPQGAVSRP
jgi:DeoR/GlpR family transcriptional regulator of sugar metabolism